MTERLQGSPDLGKLKSERSKQLLEKYQRQREQYYRTKNKCDRITEEQRRTIDAEMDEKINQLSQQESQKKGEAMAEISSIQSGLDAINTSNVENLNIPNFEFDRTIGFGSIQAIREQAQLYVYFNEGIHKKAESLSTLYNQFMQVVNKFNKEREDDTWWSGDSDYEKYVDEINQRIEKYKKLFADAEAELTRAIKKSDRDGETLNNAPDDLRREERTNQEGTEGQFKEQNERHTGQLQGYTLQGQRLQESSQRLQQGQTFLNNYSDQLVQVTDALTVQKNQVDNTILDWNNKKRDFINTMNIVCFASNVTPFSDDELRSLVSDPESFIKRIEPQERQQAALNLYNQYGQKLAEYVQIIDRYQAGVDQSNQLSQGITEIQNRQAQVTQSQQDITDQQGVVNDEIIANNTRLQNVRQLMAEDQAQHEQSLEYYGQNMDDIDRLDYEMSSIILDNDLSNGGILETVASQRKSFVGLKVSAKGGWERAFDSTIGMVGKGLRKLVIEPIKEVLLFLPNLVQKFGEDHPSIGENWLFKVLNFPFQLQAGTVEGALNLVEGLVEMCEQPMATLNGLGQLIGRDPQTGEWSFGTAGDAWLNFGKAMIAYDEWGEGNDGRALGHGAANIVSLFIPAAGEVSAAANTAKVARLLGGVSKTRAALIGVTDFGIRTGTKITKGVKGTFNSLRNIPKTVKNGWGYIDDVAEGAVKKGKAIATDAREAGGLTKYVKRGLESTRDAYHNAGGIRGLGRQSLELGTGYTITKWGARLIKGEPLFGKKFPSLKKLPNKRLKMEERLQKLRGQNGVGGELEKMYEKVNKYVDKNGDLLEGVKGTEIPMRDWGKIYDYQSALQEVRSLEATIAKYKHVETSLVDEAGNTTKLGKFIQENEKFGKAMEEMLENPSKAKDILAKFKKKNPKVDMSALEDVEIFRDGGKIYRIKNGELVEGEGVIKPTKKTYTAEDYGLKPEIYDELVEQLYLEPGTAEFNAEAVARGGKIPARLEGEVVKPKIPTAEDYGLKPEIYDELVEQLYLKPGTAEFNAEAVARGGKIPARLEGEGIIKPINLEGTIKNTNLETLEDLLNENKILENGVYKYKDGTIKQLRTELEKCSKEELENIAKTTTNPEIQNQAFQILGKREVESLKMNTGEINPNNFEAGDIIEFNDKHVPEIKVKTKYVEDGKVYYDLEVSEGTTYRHVPAEDFKIPTNPSEGIYPHNLKFAKGIRRGDVRINIENGKIVENIVEGGIGRAGEGGIVVKIPENMSLRYNNLEGFSKDILSAESKSFIEGFGDIGKPKHTFEFGENKLYVTDVMEYEGRHYVIGYTKSGEIRQFYKSNSESCWRATNGMNDGGKLSKCEYNIKNCSYETTTQVDQYLNTFLDKIEIKSVGENPLKYIRDKFVDSDNLTGPFYEQGKLVRQEFKVDEMFHKDDFKSMFSSESDLEKFIDGGWVKLRSRGTGATTEKIKEMYRNLRVEGLDMSSMVRSPGKKYVLHHKYLGEIEVDVVEMMYKGEKIDVHFARSLTNNPDQVFITRIGYHDAELNSFGCPGRQINGGPLTAKPIDYTSQTPMGWNGAKYGENYVDIRGLYQDTPLIKEYKNFIKENQTTRATEGVRAAEGIEVEIPQRTIQDIFDDLSLEKITPKEARRELAKALHPDLLGDDASILLRDALEDYNKIVSGKHPEFERSHDWSKISGEYAGKPRVTEGTRVPEGAAIPKRPKLNPARNDRFSKETLDLFDDGDIIELNYKGGKGPISERRVKENGGYRKLKENGGKYESTETVVTEEEMVTKMRDAITIDPIKWSPKGATEGTRVVPERPSPTVIELEYKGGKKTISERRVKEEGGYRKFEGESGKYERTETVLTENEMAMRIKEIKSEGGTGIEVGKETDIFEWAESRATEIKKKPVELRIMNKSEVKPNALHEGDRITWDGQEMEITKRIELDGGKVSYEFKYTEGSTTKTVEMTAEELAGDWNNVNKIMRPQIQIRGMNDYFKENVNTCKGKKLYIEGNEYTAAIDENGALHLKYSGKHKYPIKYEIGEDGKLKQVKNEALQNDITVSSFDQLKTKWNASPIDDGRSVSGTLRNNARELTLDEAKNVEFWNKLWKEEKEKAIASNERPAIENPLKPEEVKKTWAEEVAESPVVRNYSPEGYKSPIDTFDELLNSPGGVTIEGVNYRWDFSEITNPPDHIHNPKWEPNIKLIVTDRNGVPQTFKAKYNPGRELKPGEVIQPTKVLPGPKVEWEMTADGKRYPKKVEELPSNAEDIIKKYYEARQKYVDEYNRSLPVRQGEPGVPATVERPGVPATVERPGVPATVERPGVPATIERPVPTAPEIKPPLIPNVPLWVSGAVFAILANKNHEEPVHIDVPGTTGFEWTPQDQKEVSEFQEFLSKNPSGTEIKDFVRKNKDAFKKLILVKDGERGGANVNFDLLNSLIEQGKFNGLDGNIQEQLKNNIIRYIGLGEVLEEGTTFTVTSVDGKIRKGKIVNNRAVDEKGKYIPIFQGDHVESDALGFLDPIYPYSEPRVDRIDPDAELDAALEGIDG